MCRVISRNILPLEPGLVHVKRFLPLEEQVKLATLLMQEGSRASGGFWENHQKLNCTESRGRIFNRVEAFPKLFPLAGMDALKRAQSVDHTLTSVKPTHLILLYYKSLGLSPHIPWHQDNGENDGKGAFPVVSISLGDSCDFLLCHSKPRVSPHHSLANPKNLAHRVTLHSGDALVFGGDCRHIWHAIYEMHPNSAPKSLPFEGARMNMTFRYAPEILGREEDFAVINPNIGKNNQFFKLSEIGS